MANNNIYFSVVIPLYNKENCIKETVNSVLNQTYEKFEVIIVNDGSTDNSLQVVKSINDKRIRIINKENGGVSSARNKGIKEAKYEWIAFLDGDDEWLPNYLYCLKKLNLLFPETTAYATTYFINNKESRIYPHFHQIGNKPSILENYFISSTKGWPPFNSSSICVTKQFFYEYSFFPEEYTHGEDIYIWSLIALNGTIAVYPKPLSIYNRADESSSSKSIPKREFAYFNLLEANLERKGVKGFLRKGYFDYASLLHRTDWRLSLKYLVKADLVHFMLPAIKVIYNILIGR